MHHVPKVIGALLKYHLLMSSARWGWEEELYFNYLASPFEFFPAPSPPRLGILVSSSLPCSPYFRVCVPLPRI